MRKLNVSDAELLRSSLKEICIQKPDTRALYRMHCVLLVGMGHSCYQVGKWYCEDPRTIERWVKRYNTLGLNGLQSNAIGRPTKLRDDQIEQIENDVRPPLTSWEAATRCGVDGYCRHTSSAAMVNC